jgi:hypothetical protein
LTLTGIGADSRSQAAECEFRTAHQFGDFNVRGRGLGALLLYRSGGVSLPLFVCERMRANRTLIYAALPASEVRKEAGESKPKPA